MYSKRHIFKHVLFVIILFIIALIFIFSLSDIKSIFNVLGDTKISYILIALGLVLLYFIIMQLSLAILIRNKDKNIKRREAFYISGTNFFFDNITPFSTGGQPFQAYSLKRSGMRLSDSTAILLGNFITYQIAINLIFGIFLGIYYNKLSGSIDNLMWLIFISYSINLFIMILLLLIGSAKFIGDFILRATILIGKIPFLKKLIEPRINRLEVYINDTRENFKLLYHNIGLLAINFILKLIALLIYYSIPFFICRALGVELFYKDIFYIMSLTSAALTITIWIPTPGAVGGVELAFTALLQTIVVGENVEALTVSAMLLWRLMSYYFVIIYGFIMYILFEYLNKRRNLEVDIK